jgi:hypothetical protein
MSVPAMGGRWLVLSVDSPSLTCNACGHGFGQEESRRRLEDLMRDFQRPVDSAPRCGNPTLYHED